MIDQKAVPALIALRFDLSAPNLQKPVFCF